MGPFKLTLRLRLGGFGLFLLLFRNMFFWYTLLYSALHTAITASFSCCSHKAGDKIRATLLHMASLEGVNDEEKDNDVEENKNNVKEEKEFFISS